jgi:hypothetical protein
MASGGANAATAPMGEGSQHESRTHTPPHRPQASPLRQGGSHRHPQDVSQGAIVRLSAKGKDMTTQPVEIPDVQQQVAELEKAKLKALFEYTKTVAEIDERLSKLLAEGKS